MEGILIGATVANFILLIYFIGFNAEIRDRLDSHANVLNKFVDNFEYIRDNCPDVKKAIALDEMAEFLGKDTNIGSASKEV